MIKIKDRVASGLGSILEWYDFALYGFFAPLFAKLYFPSAAPSIGIIKTFAVFAIGFMARPVGALIFGYVGDKYGRTRSLKLTPVLITIPTLLFAVLPSYQQIGLFAPVSIIVLRIWQGICIGGEFANNIVYLCETARPKNLYFLGSIGSCTGSTGILMASSVAALFYAVLPFPALVSWGWRVAFAFSLVLGVLSYWMRRNMQESPIYQKTVLDKKIAKNPIINSLKNEWKSYLLTFGLTFLPAIALYFIFMFLPTYIHSSLGIKADKVLGNNSFSLLLRLFIIPVLGLIADRVGGVKLAQLACILFIILSLPLFYVITNWPSLATYAAFLFAMLTTLNAATTPGLLVEALRPETRSTIFSFTFNVSFGVFGGIVPVVSFLLSKVISSKIAPAYCLLLAGIITLAALLVVKKHGKSYAK